MKKDPTKMKRKLQMFLLFISMLTVLSCEKEVAVIDEPTTITSEEVISSLKIQQVPNSVTSELTYQGNNIWTGNWGGVTLTFSGCTPANLEAGNYCAFFATGAQGGGVIGYTSELNHGNVTITCWEAETILFTVVDVVVINNKLYYSWSTVSFYTGNGTTASFPYKLIFVDNIPILVHPDYSTFPEMPEMP